MRVACGCYLFGSFSTLYTVVCARGLNSYDDTHTTHWIICKGNLCAWCAVSLLAYLAYGGGICHHKYSYVSLRYCIYVYLYIMLWNGILIEYLTWIIMKFGKVPVRINFDHNCNYKQTPYTQGERERVVRCRVEFGFII